MRLRQLTKTANFRLAAAYAVLFSVSVIVLGAVVFLKTTSAFEEQARSRIESEAGALENAFHEGGMAELLDTIRARQRGSVVRGLVYGIVDANAGTTAGDLAGAPTAPGWSTLIGPPDGDEEPGELEQLTVLTVELDQGVWLSIGDDLGRIAQLGETMIETFGFVLLLTVALAIIGGLYISDRFLARISAITATAEAIIHGDIHNRIPRRAADDELDRLGSTLNRMLDRIVALMDALRQISSSIAHELRTPLSHLRQTLEVAQADAEAGRLPEGVFARAIEETDGLLNTFEALLRIAQIESGTRRQGFRDLDLSALVQSLVQTYETTAEDEGRALSAQIQPGILVNGDGELIAQAVVNLIENAIRHTPLGSQVRVTLTSGAHPLLTIADNGRGVPAADRERILRRFERLESSTPVHGSGLGLSIVSAIAELHDIELTLDDNRPGLSVSLRFLGRWSLAPAAPLAAATRVLSLQS